jgi:hypothetical protein
MAARRRKGGKRGRKFDPNARRHRTDRAGRRGEVDLGSQFLLARKLALTSRADCELNAVGALYGRGLLSNEQFSRLGWIAQSLRHIARACGRGFAVEGIWRGIVAAGSRTSFLPSLAGDQGARRQLTAACRELNGCRNLVLALAGEIEFPPLVVRLLRHEATADDMAQLDAMKTALDDLVLPRRAIEADDPEPRRLHPFGGGPPPP